MTKLKEHPRSQEEIFKDLVQVAGCDQGDFVAELKNLVGKDLSEAILKRGLRPSEIIDYLRTTYMIRSTRRSPSVNTTPIRLWKDASAGRD